MDTLIKYRGCEGEEEVNNIVRCEWVTERDSVFVLEGLEGILTQVI